MLFPSPLSHPSTPHISAHQIYLPSPSPSSSSSSTHQTHHHILFLPGNPGCISFYTPFLTLLAQALQNHPSSCSLSSSPISIYAASLAGFVDTPSSSAQNIPKDAHAHAHMQPVPADTFYDGEAIGLEAQITYALKAVRGYMFLHVRESKRRQEKKHELVLVGHSVGAYIALEVMRLLQEEGREEAGEGMEEGEEERGWEVLGFVGLFPTVVWIGESARGRRIGWLLRSALLAPCLSFFSHTLAFVLGSTLLNHLVTFVTRMPQAAVQTTTEFLASKDGVRTALTMARDELNTINADKWDEEIWGAASAASPKSGSRPKLMFFFGKNDHWVPDWARDELIRARGRAEVKGDDAVETWKAKMIVDEDEEIPHSFCIRHSAVVAEKTAKWIREMIRIIDEELHE